MGRACSTNGAVKYCLECGYWDFATRTGQIDYSPSVSPTFGYRYAFDHPTDFVRLVGLAEDEYFTKPLLRYESERAYWYCDLQTIYVRWVSNGASYGADISLWTEKFAKFVAAYLANEIVGNLTQDKDIIAYVVRVFDKAEKSARSLNSSGQPTRFPPPGNWTMARSGGYGYRNSRWSGR